MAKAKSTRRIKKYKPVPLVYTINKFNDYESITEMDSTRTFVYLNLVRAVRNSIQDKASTVELFYLMDHNSVICLKREDWKDSLDTAIEYFSQKEYYEKAAECQHLISLL